MPLTDSATFLDHSLVVWVVRGPILDRLLCLCTRREKTDRQSKSNQQREEEAMPQQYHLLVWLRQHRGL